MKKRRGAMQLKVGEYYIHEGDEKIVRIIRLLDNGHIKYKVTTVMDHRIGSIVGVTYTRLV